MNDKKLLQLLKQNPTAGIEQLMNQYTGLLYTVVKGRLKETYHLSSDIMDCVADVFSKFYTELDNYDPNASSIKSYLCVMARNHAINIAKKRSRQQKDYSLDDEENVIHIADNVEIESEIEGAELRKTLFDAIEALGEPDSSIIFRKYYYGESSKEISKAVGLNVSTVDTRAHRALTKLRKIFGGKQ